MTMVMYNQPVNAFLRLAPPLRSVDSLTCLRTAQDHEIGATHRTRMTFLARSHGMFGAATLAIFTLCTVRWLSCRLLLRMRTCSLSCDQRSCTVCR